MNALPAVPVLELRALDKRFRHHTVLKGLDLELGRGEIVGLLGPNGSGKTTTLRIAAGYLWPDAGEVHLNGSAVTPDEPRSRAAIGYLPERVPLYDPFSVERYLAFVAGARGLHGPDRRAAIDRVVVAFDLGDVRRRVIGQLSKGYRQRIGLAQALLGEPDVLLLDEPVNGLDPFQIIEARNFIRSAARDRAVIFSTHIVQEVEALCTRVVYLADGALVDLTSGAPHGDGERVEARVACADPANLAAAVERFDKSISITAVEPLGDGRYRMKFSLSAAQRAGLARTLATAASLEAFTAEAPTLEQRLVTVIAEAAGRKLP